MMAKVTLTTVMAVVTTVATTLMAIVTTMATTMMAILPSMAMMAMVATMIRSWSKMILAIFEFAIWNIPDCSIGIAVLESFAKDIMSQIVARFR